MESKKKVLISEVKEELVAEEKQTEISRRSFLKRSAYTAPVLIAMGQLAKPTIVHADGTGGPVGPPNVWNP